MSGGGISFPSPLDSCPAAPWLPSSAQLACQLARGTESSPGGSLLYGRVPYLGRAGYTVGNIEGRDSSSSSKKQTSTASNTDWVGALTSTFPTFPIQRRRFRPHTFIIAALLGRSLLQYYTTVLRRVEHHLLEPELELDSNPSTTTTSTNYGVLLLLLSFLLHPPVSLPDLPTYLYLPLSTLPRSNPTQPNPIIHSAIHQLQPSLHPLSHVTYLYPYLCLGLANLLGQTLAFTITTVWSRLRHQIRHPTPNSVLLQALPRNNPILLATHARQRRLLSTKQHQLLPHATNQPSSTDPTANDP